MLQKTNTQKTDKNRLNPGNEVVNFSQRIIAWYAENKRDLPWRETLDPYKIWLSEIILQQTRVIQGLPYYHRFIEQYQDVVELAKADEQEILRTWQGLGYYSRARNLHKCAKIIRDNYGGKFPVTYQEIIKLPGIGPYTGAAIASFAFGESKAVVDGNVYRVLARIYGLFDDIASGSGQARFAALATELLSKVNPAEHNQAIMEFGALQCTPKSPNCPNCIFLAECKASLQKTQSELPVKTKKIKVRNRYFHYLCLRQKDKLLMKQRAVKDIWQGLHDFILVETEGVTDLDTIITKQKNLIGILKKSTSVEKSNDYIHILSHQKIHATFYTIDLPSDFIINDHLDNKNMKWLDLDQVLAVPKAVLVSRYLNDEIFS